MGTVAGSLVTCDGRSPFATIMLALNAKMFFALGDETITLGNYLPTRAGASNKLITKIEIPLNVQLAFETVARTPSDKPIVCAALAQWPSGRTRLALGGFGACPALALDGNAPNDLEAAARNAFTDAGRQLRDHWGRCHPKRVRGRLQNRPAQGGAPGRPYTGAAQTIGLSEGVRATVSKAS